jgi:transcriptional regulator with XRE-family HTH domain
MKYQTIGQYIREQRLLRHMSLKQLSMLCSTSISYLSRLERDEDTPDISLLVTISKALYIPLERILMACGYIVSEPYDIETFQLLETFLSQKEVKEKFNIDIENISPNEKQELIMHLGNALEIITYRYR